MTLWRVTSTICHSFTYSWNIHDDPAFSLLFPQICHLFTYIHMHENTSFSNLHAIIGMCYHHQNISKKDSFFSAVIILSKENQNRNLIGVSEVWSLSLILFCQISFFPICGSFLKRGNFSALYLHYISDNIPPLDCVIDPLRNCSLSNKSHLLSKGQRSLSNFVNYLIIHLFKHEFVQVFPDTAVFDWYITLAEKYK